MTIVRKFNKTRYTQINNELIDDTRLSLAARMLLIILLSKPDNWKLSVAHLIKQSDAGEKYIRARLKELENCKYLRKVLVKDANGKITGTDWIIYETPKDYEKDIVGDLPQSRNEAAANGHAADGHAAKEGLVNTEYIVITEDNNNISRFDEFWAQYPNKCDKKKAREIWKRKKLDKKADMIIRDVITRKANHARWLNGFIPNPSTYLRNERWEDEIQRVNINGKSAFEQAINGK